MTAKEKQFFKDFCFIYETMDRQKGMDWAAKTCFYQRAKKFLGEEIPEYTQADIDDGAKENKEFDRVRATGNEGAFFGWALVVYCAMCVFAYLISSIIEVFR